MKEDNSQHVMRDVKRVLNWILDDLNESNVKELKAFDDCYLFEQLNYFT